MTGTDERFQIELNREALARIRHLVSGDATVGDVEEAQRWRRLSLAHEEAFASATQLWESLGPAGMNVRNREIAAALLQRTQPASPNFSRRALLGGAAAAASVYLIARPPFGIWPSLSELTADYRTGTGEQQRIVLDDGSSVELNTQTSVSLRQRSENRDQIELLRGEAVLTTRRELPRPVLVIAGGGYTSAENASLNIRYDGRDTCVTCLEGSVSVQFRGSNLTLGPGQQAAYGERGLSQPIAIDPSAVTAWRGGLLVFKSTPLAEVIAEINRYRPGRIVLMNSELGQRPINARFRIGHTDEIMTLAKRAFGARVTALPGGIVVLS